MLGTSYVQNIVLLHITQVILWRLPSLFILYARATAGETAQIALSARKPRVFGRTRRESTYLHSFKNGRLLAVYETAKRLF
jgi:hypothetical protein